MNYLGTITAATTVAHNNATTAVPFVIPEGCNTVHVQSDTAGVQFEEGETAAFETTAVRGAFLAAANTLYGPFSVNRDAQKWISVYNPTGSTVNVRVYGG